MTKHTEKKSKPGVTRRQFLGFAWGGSLLALFGQGAAALMSYLQPVSAGGFGGKVYAGRVDEFSVGSVSRVMTGRFYLVRTDEGFLALWQKCTHLGCSVPWADNEDQFHCPCHGSLFNKMGEVTGGPAPRPMDAFPVEIVDGEVWVDTSKPMERTRFDISQITRV